MRFRKILIIILCIILCGCSKKYTVTFNTNGGNDMDSIAVKKGDNLNNISAPTREGYVFVNWLKDNLEYNLNTSINEDITLTANWIKAPNLEKVYNVSFNVEGTITKKEVKGNTLLERPTDPIKEKYKFIGWYIGTTEYDFTSKVTKDISLVAKFEKEKVTITFNLNGGAGITTKTIEKGTSLSIPNNPVKFGYRFISWQYLEKDFNFETNIEKDITLTAKWEPTTYVKVTFDTDGGSEIKNQTIEKGTTLGSIETPVKEGYIFKYWSHNGEKFDLTVKIEEAITLIAIYEKKS